MIAIAIAIANLGGSGAGAAGPHAVLFIGMLGTPFSRLGFFMLGSPGVG